MGINGHMNITSASRPHQAIKRRFEKVVDGFPVIQALRSITLFLCLSLPAKRH
jgi:hypothetical protein